MKPLPNKLNVILSVSEGSAFLFCLTVITVVLMSLFFFPSVSGSVEIAVGEGKDLVLNPNAALKASLLVPEGGSALNLWRLRLGMDFKYRSQGKAGIAYEQRIRTNPGGSGNGIAVLPPDVEAPYRLTQWDWSLSEKAGEYSYRHEIDRAFLALNLERVDVTLGRQAVGWGRGVIFSAVDVFAPFQPLEVDREWRRGVDAVRADLKVSDHSSLDVVGAFGPEMEESAFLGRMRGFAGRLDAELIFGKRAGDWLSAATFSVAVLDAEVHGEFAFFDTPERFPDGGLYLGDHGAVKGVLGASYTFGWGNGLSTWVEYYYSGFGLEDVGEAALRLVSSPDYLSRYLRGDTQIFGRQALALRAAYEWSDLLSTSLIWITNPDDLSGVASPVLTSTFSDNLSVAASAFFPYGSGLDNSGLPRSEYGSSPLSGFLQVNIYY